MSVEHAHNDEMFVAPEDGPDVINRIREGNDDVRRKIIKDMADSDALPLS